jgi:hypothetical protein
MVTVDKLIAQKVKKSRMPTLLEAEMSIQSKPFTLAVAVKGTSLTLAALRMGLGLERELLEAD